MHPHLVHQTTTKAPDSGLKLGFVDIPPQPYQSLASVQNTPSKARSDTPAHFSSSKFDFKFGTDSQLSSEAQKLMDNVREEAARIKAQMQAEKEAQQQKDAEAEATFGGINAAGRKIAKAKGRAGRFSDIHMAQFKKMDSIANHASAYRSKPGFAQPTTQSLKRSGSKAGLDEVDRPRTAGKGTPGRLPPPFLGRPTSVSPFKSIPVQPERTENVTSAKRAKHSQLHDVSTSRSTEPTQQAPRRTVLHKPTSNSLLSPTKASLARAAASQIPVVSPNKPPPLKRTTSVKSLRPTSVDSDARPATAHGGIIVQSPSKLPRVESSLLDRPLPALPTVDLPPSPEKLAGLQRSKSTTEPSAFISGQGFVSKLPTFSGLRSILRSGRKTDASPSIDHRSGTPKRPNTATSVNDSAKKVDFTPSVKSRYAVKLAAGSPSPAKLPGFSPGKLPAAPIVEFDSAAYVLQDDDGDEAWEDAGSEIEYPILPDTCSDQDQHEVERSFSEMAKDHKRRESKEFKSIFTTLHHPSRPTAPSNLTSVNTTVNKTDPTIHANQVMRSPSNADFSRPSPNTIRRVRTSGVTDLVQPFEDADVKTVPHGLPGKKRRRGSTVSEHQSATQGDGKENYRVSVIPSIPGGWQDSSQLDEQDEGVRRGGKRIRIAPEPDSGKKVLDQKAKDEPKKPRQSSAREMAKNNAKERKGRAILSLSRLNMLSRPKQRG